jgi:hypothetical protein
MRRHAVVVLLKTVVKLIATVLLVTKDHVSNTVHATAACSIAASA